MTLPTLTSHEHGFTFHVDGRPTILLGGQVHNSTTSSVASIAESFAKVRELNYNFVIGSLNWNQFEPAEGTFDTTLLQAQIKHAELNHLKLVLLWFGAFKNAASTYAPTWVRADRKRFPRAKKVEGADTGWGTNQSPVLSLFSSDLLAADRAAFEALMTHLRDNDPKHTVVMVQIENESGLLGASRDFSDLAEAKWQAAVPSELIEGLQTKLLAADSVTKETWQAAGSKLEGTWAEVFGNNWQAHEIFMAWHMGQYANTLAEAGKAIKNLPMYVNAWLGPQPGQDEAGQWPSGGPSKNVLGIWKIAAPRVDILSPDIYIEDAISVMQDYARPDNALFIPESRHIAGNMFWSLANHSGIGYAMFGAEDGRIGNQMSEAYGVLVEATEVIATAAAEGRIKAVLMQPEQLELPLAFGEITVTATNSLGKLKRFVEVAGVDLELKDFESISELEGAAVTIPSNSDARPFALVIQESPIDFLLIGKGINLQFASSEFEVEIDRVQEGWFNNGEWITGRELNGDERLQFVPLHEIACAKIRILPFKS